MGTEQHGPPQGTAIGEPLRYALAYAALGWQVFPVHWIGADGRCSCGQVCDSPGKHPIRELAPHGFQDATTDADQLRRWWGQHPAANVAVRTGAASGIWVLDVDCAGEKQGDVALEALADQYGGLPDTALAYTGSGGQHYVFRYPAEGAVRNRTNTPARSVDVRGDGGYVVVAPSTHISGGAYEWEASSDPLEGQGIAEAPAWLLDAVREHGGTAEAGPPAAAAGGMLTREQVLELKSALDYLDPDDYHRWIEVGQALHASGAGRQAYGIWSDWSRQSEKYNAEIQAKKWRSFTAGRGLNLESIFAWAQAAGWVNPASNEYQEWLERNRAAIEQANRQRRLTTVEPQPVTEHSIPVAALEDAAAWMRAQLPMRQSHAVTQAVLSVASLMAARRYVSADGDPAHTYLGVVTRSLGTVRELKNLTNRIIAECGQRQLIRGTRINTTHLLYKTLLRWPAVHWIADDYGQMVAFARRQPSGHVWNALSAIADAYSNRAIYLDQDVDPIALKHYDDCTIYDAAPCILGLISDNEIGTLAKRSEIGRGAMEQMLCVCCGDPEANTALRRNLPLPEATVTVARELRTPRGDGNLVDTLPGTLPATMTEVVFPPTVRETLHDYDDQLMGLIGSQRHLLPLATGAQQTMRRLLVTLAAWRRPNDPQADRELAEWVGGYVREHLAVFIERVQLASEDGKPDVYERVLEVLQEAGADGTTRRELARRCRAFRALNTDQRGELLERMLGDELVVEMPNGKTTKLVDARFVEEVVK